MAVAISVACPPATRDSTIIGQTPPLLLLGGGEWVREEMGGGGGEFGWACLHKRDA